MTELREIQPINLQGLDIDAPLAGEPICERVDPRTLFVDPAYQRDIGERGLRQIRQIVEAFDWRKFKPPICAYAEHDGNTVLKVIDGQHTAIAAVSHPKIGMIPVMIIEAADTSDQAAAFVGQNTSRLGMTPLQLYRAALVAKDEDAQTVAQVCDRAGIVILDNPPSRGVFRECETVAINSIRRLVDKRGAMRARMVLDILGKALLAPVKDTHIQAVDLLMHDPDYRDQYEPDDLTKEIVTSGRAAEHEAKLFAVSHKVPVWKALAIVWFRKTKKKRGALKAVA